MHGRSMQQGGGGGGPGQAGGTEALMAAADAELARQLLASCSPQMPETGQCLPQHEVVGCTQPTQHQAPATRIPEEGGSWEGWLPSSVAVCSRIGGSCSAADMRTLLQHAPRAPDGHGAVGGGLPLGSCHQGGLQLHRSFLPQPLDLVLQAPPAGSAAGSWEWTTAQGRRLGRHCCCRC